MIPVGPVAMPPSSLHRVVRRLSLPCAVLLCGSAAIAAQHLWPLLWLGVFALFWVLAGTRFDNVRGCVLAGDGLRIDRGDGRWCAACVRGPARPFSWAIFLPCVDERGRECWVVFWRDAVDDATFRRLSRMARAHRWPGLA